MSKAAYDYSIRLLSKRDYSRFKLKQKLILRGFEEEEIDHALEEVADKGFLREEEYMRIRVKTLLINGHANKIIQMRLEQEELFPSDEFINEIREENDLGDEDVVDSLIQKKLRGKSIPEDFESKIKLQNKILNFLISKGHNYQDVKDKVSRHINDRVNS